MINYTNKCVYKNCIFKCASENAHKAKYASMNVWKKNIKNIDKNIQKNPSNKINWEHLKNIGVLYELPNKKKNIDYDKLDLKSIYPKKNERD
jgi:hypothetical protein